MLPQFYGTINADGTTDESAASSANFSPSKTGTSTYQIVFDTWIAYKPTVSVTGLNVSGQTSEFPSYWLTQDPNNKQYTLSVKMHDHSSGGKDAASPFSFTAVTGTNISMQMDSTTTVTLVPNIIAFGGNSTPILTLQAQANGQNYPIDAATALLINVPQNQSATDIKFQLSQATCEYNGDTFNLKGYTNGPTMAQAQAWPETTWTTLAVPDPGTRSAFDEFTVVATDNQGNVLWADPIVRLRKTGGTPA